MKGGEAYAQNVLSALRRTRTNAWNLKNQEKHSIECLLIYASFRRFDILNMSLEHFFAYDSVCCRKYANSNITQNVREFRIFRCIFTFAFGVTTPFCSLHMEAVTIRFLQAL